PRCTLSRRRDLSSLLFVSTGGASLGREVAERFAAIFPNVTIVIFVNQLQIPSQNYVVVVGLRFDGIVWRGGLDGWAGGVQGVLFSGKLASHVEVKIVEPASGEALRPGQRGVLWVRGPSIMKG
ncbi:hypothetical protein EJB05_09703, partial [Eragrostis curvula]